MALDCLLKYANDGFEILIMPFILAKILIAHMMPMNLLLIAYVYTCLWQDKEVHFGLFANISKLLCEKEFVNLKHRLHKQTFVLKKEEN